MRRTFIAGAMAHVANAWWIDPAPSATNAVAMKELGDAQGWSPIPTTAPYHRDMIRRQAATQILGYLAPDNTCGYVAGRIGGIKTCETDANCAAVLGTDAFYTMGCCGAGACTMQGACYDYASMASCDQACMQDANIVKCSGTSYPYCYPYSVPGMNMGFYSCDSVTTSAFQEFETTFSGQSGRATWLALRSSDFDALLDTSTSGTTTRTRTSDTPSTDTSTTSSRRPFTTTPVPCSGSDCDDDDDSSTPIGAIVGGVVGGLAALGLLAGAIIFFLFKKRKNKKNAAAAGGAAPGTDPHMSQYGNAPPPAGPNNGGYFAPVAEGGKFDNSAAKYDGPAGSGPTITESNYPGPTPVSPAPAYSAPMQQGNPVSPQFVPSPAGSPPPQDPRYSYVPPPQPGYSEAPGAPYSPSPQQPYYPPPSGAGAPPAPQGQSAPVELGNTYAVPNQYQGRPVYEAA